MSKVITRPAALVKQGNLQLYSTSLSVSDLMTPDFYSIERLDPEDPNHSGYQRVLNKARAKRLAEYLVDGQQSHDAFLPTSLFLATDKNISLDTATNTITFDVERVGPFSVVDGQHRLEGLRMAMEKKPEIGSFEVPVNIAVNMPPIAQMCHFLIVNTTQKSVDKSVEQRIFAHLTQALTFEDVPTLPKWIQRVVESKDDEKALRIVDYLNETKDSPWYGKVRMANQDSKTATINQQSFVQAIKRYVLTPSNFISMKSADDQQKMFSNYWKAIANILDDGRQSVLFKYGGVELFCRFSTVLFGRLQTSNNFSVNTIEKTLRDTFDNLDGEYAGLAHPDWWASGTGPAGTYNAGALGNQWC